MKEDKLSASLSNPLQQMALWEKLLKLFLLFNKDAFSKIVIFIFLLFVVEWMFINTTFTCPCKIVLNRQIIASIFFGPCLLLFFVMFIWLRPFRYAYFNVKERRSAIDAEDSKVPRYCPEFFAYCLIPPFFWIILLLLNGDYVACASTTWEGKYVMDWDLGRKWCQPIDQFYIMNRNYSEERHLYQSYVSKSQSGGYILLGVFSLIIIVFVGIYDCFQSGKSKCSRGKHEDTQQGQQGACRDDCELDPLVV